MKKCFKYKIEIYFRNKFEYTYYVDACDNKHAVNIAKLRMRIKYGTDKQHIFKATKIK